MPSADVIIIGGGVIGLSLAWQLAQQAVQVMVVDQGTKRDRSSWAGAGILPPVANANATDAYEEFRAESHRLHAAWAAQLLEETGIDTGFRRCGGLYLATTGAEFATMAAQEFWCVEQQIAIERWTPAQLAAVEPEIDAQRIRAAWWMPEECQLRNPRHLQALETACLQRGVRFEREQSVTEILVQSGKAFGVRTVAGELSANTVCICTGAWARKALEGLGLTSGIMPIRGQMVLYRAAQPFLDRIVNEGHRYLVPREDGRMLAGSVEEEVGYRLETTDSAIQSIRDWAESVCPRLAQTPIDDCWAGLRPGSYDGLPYIGPVGAVENLFMGAGHFRSGIHLSCATAVALAELIQGRASSMDLTPFRPARG